MCLFVWVGSARGLTPHRAPPGDAPDPLLGYYSVQPVLPDAPIARHFAARAISCVGSHEGCGCGYNADTSRFDGFESMEDVLALMGALSTEEQGELLAGHRSRERLRDLIVEASRWGDVEVYACWSGDEEEPATETREVDADHFTRLLQPLAEGVKYLIRQTA
jgi:hypothetical protein